MGQIQTATQSSTTLSGLCQKMWVVSMQEFRIVTTPMESPARTRSRTRGSGSLTQLSRSSAPSINLEHVQTTPEIINKQYTEIIKAFEMYILQICWQLYHLIKNIS